VNYSSPYHCLRYKALHHVDSREMQRRQENCHVSDFEHCAGAHKKECRIEIRDLRIYWIRIWIYGSGSRVFWWPKTEEEKIQRKFIFSFFIKNCNFLMSKLMKNPSVLKREHPALQKMNVINFVLCLWVILALLDPANSRFGCAGRKMLYFLLSFIRTEYQQFYIDREQCKVCC